MFRARKFKALEKALGYRFRNEALLERALTHASVRGGKRNAARINNPPRELMLAGIGRGHRTLG